MYSPPPACRALHSLHPWRTPTALPTTSPCTPSARCTWPPRTHAGTRRIASHAAPPCEPPPQQHQQQYYTSSLQSSRARTPCTRGSAMAPPRALPLLALLLAALLPAAQPLDRYIEDTDRFPGWRGELPGSVQEELGETVGFGELGRVRAGAQSGGEGGEGAGTKAHRTGRAHGSCRTRP